MNDLYSWAGSQPLWLQVVIGLFVFFVAIPAGIASFLLVLGGISAAMGFVETCVRVGALPVLVVLIACAIAYGIWEGSALIAWQFCYKLRELLPSNAEKFEAVYQGVTLLCRILATLLVGMSLFLKRKWLIQLAQKHVDKALGLGGEA